MKIKLIIVFAMAFSKLISYKPGILLKIHKSSFNEALKMILPLVNPHLSNVVINQEIEADFIKIHQLTINVQPLVPANFKIQFLSDLVKMLFILKDVRIDIRAEATLKYKFFKSSGHI